MNKSDPRERLRQILDRYPKAKGDPERLWRIFEAEMHDDRALAAAVMREVAATWFPEAFKQL
jgi:hypothetical protein